MAKHRTTIFRTARTGSGSDVLPEPVLSPNDGFHKRIETNKKAICLVKYKENRLVKQKGYRLVKYKGDCLVFTKRVPLYFTREIAL